MYGTHFGLASAPFRITPDTRRFYPGAQRGAVLDALAYAIEQGEGIVKLSGEVGSGKTMLCRMLADRLAARVDVVYLANPSLQREDVLRAIAFELKLPTRGGRLEILQALHQYLLARHAEGRRVAVFVEEAQCMDLDALEEIRLLSNLETREDKLLQIVLFGQPELDEHLAVHAVRQLRDRITHSFSLPPLGRAAVRDYIQFRLRAAGYQGGDPFTPMAYRLLTRASKGLIRRLHILADKALLAAYADGCRQVNLRSMRRAVADSEFASSGWSGPRALWAGVASLALALTATLGYAISTAPANPAPATAGLAQVQPAAGPATPLAPDVAVAKTSAPAGLLDARIAATRTWLAADAPSGFSIQVMTSDGPDTAPLARLLLDQNLQTHLDRIYIAPAQVAGRQRWSVLYGEFETYAAAQRALAVLPAALQGHGPYLRSLTAIQKEASSHWLSTQQDSLSNRSVHPASPFWRPCCC